MLLVLLHLQLRKPRAFPAEVRFLYVPPSSRCSPVDSPHLLRHQLSVRDMANPADIPAIHSIINSVNRHAPIASPDVPPEQLARDRGTFLATMAHSILNIIRDGIDAEGKRQYEAVYAILEAASQGDPEQYLQAGEALWAFTLQAFQLATHRRVTGHARDQRGASAHPPPDPRAYARGQARNAGGSAYALDHGGAHQMGVPVGTTAGSPSTNVIVLHSPCCHTPHQTYLHASPVPQPRALSPLPPPPPPPPPRTPTPPLAPAPPAQVSPIYIITTPCHAPAALPTSMPFCFPTPPFSPAMFPVASPLAVPVPLSVSASTPVWSPRTSSRYV
ncbi:uncharacterized protein C8Q71DRAFT_912055 [Rhodofomes roseus]|uniref:Uncharacterized protein n=1 Tax=Rhodofomes roseus TaxID=34475 RepID=A0ABQ8JXY7_9APHY|nr:uncharacterized protein C8Q71DRAFT_912055 [Rhodofomes roseus]KAH9829105.1 hypothetical protein C8Q71DRAFT_912055 [Rhodofomes roseus]